MGMTGTKRLAVLALFTVLALALAAVDNAIPPLLPIPGIRLGLANIVTLFLLLRRSGKDALAVLAARIFLSAFLFGQAVSLLYSLAGGVFCLAVMLAVRLLLRRHFPILISMTGGISHNLGQILAAFALTGSASILAYVPFLLISGVLTGFFTGLCTDFLRKIIPEDV
ncbi:MAG: Gx transporter family protein [Clostridium sp.]|jgi:heptaprenyl diphosphate synthase|nr:Gx transporter family protein [Clostridium sp.]